MADVSAGNVSAGNVSAGKLPPAGELPDMHVVYRLGGQERKSGPMSCIPRRSVPTGVCGQKLQAIDFRLEYHGRAVQDP